MTSTFSELTNTLSIPANTGEKNGAMKVKVSSRMINCKGGLHYVMERVEEEQAQKNLVATTLP